MEEVNYFLFTDGMVIKINDPQNSTRKLLKLINTFSKVARYKINTQKSVVLLHTDDKWSDIEIMETPFPTAPQNTRITQTKQLEDLYNKNLNTPKKKLK